MRVWISSKCKPLGGRGEYKIEEDKVSLIEASHGELILASFFRFFFFYLGPGASENDFLQGGNLGLCLLWHFMHLIVSIWYSVHGLVNAIESFLISSGLLKKYRNIDISKVKYLAVVIDSEEALGTLKVLELLRWLSDIGLKKVCLYDKEGVLKKSKGSLTLWLKTERMSKETTGGPLVKPKFMSLEVISFSDSKDAVAKAANFLLKKHYLDANEKPQLTEPDMADALEAIGYATVEPDLMLIYGPARCHLGFPAWRCRYTEMVHMGPLKSMRFGAIIKAIHRFTTVHQNYGTYVLLSILRLVMEVQFIRIKNILIVLNCSARTNPFILAFSVLKSFLRFFPSPNFLDQLPVDLSEFKTGLVKPK